METQERKLRTNLDTDLLKLVAIAAMLLDHIGGAFFPETPIFRWIGWLAFPLFCYCLTVGLLYTHDIRRYLGRLAIFAVVSQPFWILAFNADDILGNLTNWNIFFTLFLSLLAMCCIPCSGFPPCGAAPWRTPWPWWWAATPSTGPSSACWPCR